MSENRVYEMRLNVVRRYVFWRSNRSPLAIPKTVQSKPIVSSEKKRKTANAYLSALVIPCAKRLGETTQ